jgi:hypothetical protein
MTNDTTYAQIPDLYSQFDFKKSTYATTQRYEIYMVQRNYAAHLNFDLRSWNHLFQFINNGLLPEEQRQGKEFIVQHADTDVYVMGNVTVEDYMKIQFALIEMNFIFTDNSNANALEGILKLSKELKETMATLGIEKRASNIEESRKISEILEGYTRAIDKRNAAIAIAKEKALAQLREVEIEEMANKILQEELAQSEKRKKSKASIKIDSVVESGKIDDSFSKLFPKPEPTLEKVDSEGEKAPDVKTVDNKAK